MFCSVSSTLVASVMLLVLACHLAEGRDCSSSCQTSFVACCRCHCCACQRVGKRFPISSRSSPAIARIGNQGFDKYVNLHAYRAALAEYLLYNEDAQSKEVSNVPEGQLKRNDVEDQKRHWNKIIPFGGEIYSHATYLNDQPMSLSTVPSRPGPFFDGTRKMPVHGPARSHQGDTVQFFPWPDRPFMIYRHPRAGNRSVRGAINDQERYEYLKKSSGKGGKPKMIKSANRPVMLKPFWDKLHLFGSMQSG